MSSIPAVTYIRVVRNINLILQDVFTHIFAPVLKAMDSHIRRPFLGDLA